MEHSGLNQQTDKKQQQAYDVDTTMAQEGYKNFSVTIRDEAGKRICILAFHAANRPVNILSFELMQELDDFLDSQDAASVDYLVLTSKQSGIFMAGADITMIDAITQEQDAREKVEAGKDLFLKLRKLSGKTVAWVNGTCLGGGYELAMFCDLIVMEGNTKATIGLPETKLGIIPGFAGTVHLPKRIGPKNALDIILKGKAVDAKKAKRLGMIDAVMPPNTVPTVQTCEQLFKYKKKNKKPVWVTAIRSALTPIVVHLARKSIDKMSEQYPALRAACDVVGKTYYLPESKAYAIENDAFASVAVTLTSKNLIRVFNLLEEAKKLGKTSKDVPPIKSLAVVGGGVMGMGISVAAAKVGIFSRCKDLKQDILNSSLKYTQRASKKVWKRWTSRLQSNLRLQTDDFGLNTADCVIEAVLENLELKNKIFKDLETKVPENCLLVTNTSSLPLSAMSAELKHPERFAGLHFFNPVLRMPLVEVIKGEHTSDETVSRLCAFVNKMGKVPLVCKDTSGFVVNRLLGFYLNEGIHLLADGVEASRMEKVAKRFGFPMGPLRLLDEVGIDVATHVSRILNEQHGDRYEPREGLEKMAEEGRLGKKSQKGFYIYDSKKKETLDESYCQHLRASLSDGAKKVDVTNEDIVDRLVLPMIAEGCRLVDEKVVSDPSWVDVGMIFGAGFPPYRGGIMAYAKSIGVTRVEDRLTELYEKYPYSKRFELGKEQEVLHML